MSLIGNFSTMPLEDVLQWLSLARKTGILILEKTPVVKELYLQNGQIVSSSSNDPREYLGQFLLAHGRIDEATLAMIFKKQGKTGIMLGRLLVQENLLTEEEVQAFLRLKAEEAVYELFLWREGFFKFYGDLPADERHVQIAIDSTALVMEGLRRSDEWKRITTVIPGPHTIIRSRPDPSGVLANDPVFARLLAATAVPRAVGELALDLHAGEFVIYKGLFELITAGVIEVVDAGASAPAPLPSGDDNANVLSAALRDINEKRPEAARIKIEQVLARDPEHTVAKLLQKRVMSDARTQVSPMEFTLERVPLLKMSLGELAAQRFTPAENFILSRIDGHKEVGAITRVAPINTLDALAIFKRLAERNVIEFAPARA